MSPASFLALHEKLSADLGRLPFIRELSAATGLPQSNVYRKLLRLGLSTAGHASTPGPAYRPSKRRGPSTRPHLTAGVAASLERAALSLGREHKRAAAYMRQVAAWKLGGTTKGGA